MGTVANSNRTGYFRRIVKANRNCAFSYSF